MKIFPSNEPLYKNVLNREFQKPFFGLYVLQSIFGTAKFHLGDNFVTTPLRQQNLYSFVLTIFLTCLCYLDFAMSSVENAFDISIFIFKHTFCVTMYVVVVVKNYFDSKNSVKLMISLQEIDINLDIAKNNPYSGYCIVTTCVSVFTTVSYIVYGVLQYRILNTWKFTSLFIIVFNTVGDFEIVFCGFVVHFLWNRLSRWTKAISGCPYGSPDLAKAFVGHRDTSKLPADVKPQEDLFSKDMLSNIIQAFLMTMEIFKVQIIIAVVYNLFHALTVLSLYLRILRETNNFIVATKVTLFVNLVWFLVKFVYVTVLCITCERFYSIVEQAKSICVDIIREPSVNLTMKRLAKNALRSSQCWLGKYSACGALVVDGRLPLSLLGLIATYCIVILQFEFL